MSQPPGGGELSALRAREARPRVPVSCCKNETSVVKRQHRATHKWMCIITDFKTNLYIEHGHKRFQRPIN